MIVSTKEFQHISRFFGFFYSVWIYYVLGLDSVDWSTKYCLMVRICKFQCYHHA
jgi:hypothetical protein